MTNLLIYCDDRVLPFLHRGFFPFLTLDARKANFSFGVTTDATVAQDFMTLWLDYKFYRTIGGFVVEGEKFRVFVDHKFSRIDLFDFALSYKPDGIIDSLWHLSYHIFSCFMIMNNSLCIHAASVIYKNEGISFCGVSGAGKSTQAHLWEKYLGGYSLNYDRPLLSLNTVTPLICGTPWSGKESRYLNLQYKAKALVFVVKSSENVVKKLSPQSAFARIYQHFYPITVFESVLCRFEELSKLCAMKIPTYEFRCTISEEAVITLYNELFDEEYRLDEGGKVRLKIKDGYVLREVAGEWVVIARGEKAVDTGSVMLLNETSAFLWNLLKNECSVQQLTMSLLSEYNVDDETANRDVKGFIDILKNAGVIETE